jgi:hypothetical protein
MKRPPKPFTAEVKRSRFSTPVAKPISGEPPFFIEVEPAPAPAVPSQARRLAEQLFTSRTASKSAEPETMLTAERLFRAVAPRAATVEEQAVETRAKVPVIQVPSAEETLPAEPRKPRAGKVRTSLAAAHGVAKPKKPETVKAAALCIPAHPGQNLHIVIPEASSPAVRIDQAGLPSSAVQSKSQEPQNWGWGLGERWKRRLRQLR